MVTTDFSVPSNDLKELENADGLGGGVTHVPISGLPGNRILQLPRFSNKVVKPS